MNTDAIRRNLWQGPCAALGFFATHQLLDHFSRFFWYLPAGLRFTAFALLPMRLWPWLVAAEWFARERINWQHDMPVWYSLCSAVPQPFAALLAVAFAYSARIPVRIEDSPRDMTRLVLALLVAATLGAAANVLFVVAAPYPLQDISLAAFAANALLGDLCGLLVIAPLGLALASPMARHAWRLSFQIDLFCGVLLPLAGLAWLMRLPATEFVHDYARMAVAAPVVYFAFRHGWRGAATAITLAGIVLAPLHLDFETAPDPTVAVQLLFAILAIAALLLGAALDAQRADALALARQNASLDQLGAELREAAQRNLRIEEEQRRRLAIEIHDELGQNLTAVHTRLKLAEERLDAADLADVRHSIVDLIGTMRRSVHGLMDSLRPPALNEFGLRGALENGPIRELVVGAGLRYACRVHDPLALLGLLREDMQIALWRLAQEATTNATRHARATSVAVRLRAGLRGDAVWAFLDVRDDGVGIAGTRDFAHRGEGLQGMRDRVLAFDGRLLVEPARGGGTRVHALLRQAT